MKFVFYITFFSFFISCSSDPYKLVPHEGYVEVAGGKIWYKVIGDGPGIPLMALHGGPGSRSCTTIEGFSLLSGERPVIIFDQLESGNSDRPNDTTLWKLPYFVKQVEAIRDALHLEEFHLLGSSWGGSVAVEYMLTAETKYITSVIFSGPLISTPQWMKDSKVLISRLSQPVQDTINKYENLEEYDHPEYLAATDTFYANFLTRKEWPRTSSPAECEGSRGSNGLIYNYMWGPTEFKSTGTLRDFDRIEQLHTISTPTLFIGGEYDEVLPETLEYYQTLVSGSSMIITPNAGHAQIGDNPAFYTKAINDFMLEIERIDVR
jgi:proline iminopeptidase